jgi:carbohydrate diacid regulator
MTPQKIFQDYINRIDSKGTHPFGVINSKGTIIACTDISQVGTSTVLFSDDLKIFGHAKNVGSGKNNRDNRSDKVEPETPHVIDGATYFAFGDPTFADYAVYTPGTDNAAKESVRFIASLFSLLLENFDKKFDRDNFIKTVTFKNIIPAEISTKAKELGIEFDVTRCVFIIEFKSKKNPISTDTVRNLFPDKNRDFIFSNKENEILLIKEFKRDITSEKLEKLGEYILDTLNSEFFAEASIGIGRSFSDLGSLPNAYSEAEIALKIGTVFNMNKGILSYDNLGIARLIYHIPPQLCEVFINEVFKMGSIETLDAETLSTILRFFENNLNVSETSRKLFVHRNTLVYRLEKIKKITGLDLRRFDHAIVFKIALMVKKFLNSIENNTSPTLY